MTDCYICGEKDSLIRRCNHCNLPVCGEHRLPENHGCPALLESDESEEWFDEKFENIDEERVGGSRETKSGGYETVDPDTKYRRRDIEPEYEHESPALNPDGSLETDDDEENSIEENENKTGLSPFSRLMFLLLASGLLVSMVYFLWL